MSSSAASANPPRMRADAVRNRARIVEAAKAIFAEQGLDVPMTEIADRAGVGVGTLYRRFACREDLITAIFEADMTGYAVAAEEALAEPDPWCVLSSLLMRMCEWQAEDRGFSDILLTSIPKLEQVECQRDRIYDAVSALIDRAHASGQIRPDVTAEDVALLLIANAGLVAATQDVAPDAWRRMAALYIASLRAANTEKAPPPPENAVVYEVLRRGRVRVVGSTTLSSRSGSGPA